LIDDSLSEFAATVPPPIVCTATLLTPSTPRSLSVTYAGLPLALVTIVLIRKG
jgi:hypothetical protein